MNDAGGRRGPSGFSQGGGDFLRTGAKVGNRLAHPAQLVKLRPGELIGMFVAVSGALLQGGEPDFAAMPDKLQHLRAPSRGAAEIELRLFFGAGGLAGQLHGVGGLLEGAQPRLAHRRMVRLPPAHYGQPHRGGVRHCRGLKQGAEQLLVVQKGHGGHAHLVVGVLAGALCKALLHGGRLLGGQRPDGVKPGLRLGGRQRVADRKQA